MTFLSSFKLSNFRGRLQGEEKNEVLVGRERASSFASLGLSVGFVRLANVLVRVLAILQSLLKSL